MCGIAGVLYFDGRPADASRLKKMGDAIAHRGPDGEGFYSRPGLGLVHRRLSIIDIDGGTQPIANEDGSVHVVFNGEIYNYRTIRTALQKRGHQFKSNSDTETLVHLYEEVGRNLPCQLRGMFAFAIWDEKEQCLVLGRDRVGQKPLYYYRCADKFVFGSEIKAILAHGGIDQTIDANAIESYLTLGMIPGEQSIYGKIRKLLPGHVLIVRANGESTAHRYWEYPVATPDESTDFDALRHQVEDAVQSHLVSDVPVGGFLSGGVDSTVVCSLASGSTPSPLATFCIGFADGPSETSVAKETAERIGSIHREAIIDSDAATDLDRVVDVYDEPFGDSSAIPTMRVSELAASEVKVVLSGDGGDECFGGYARYAHDLKESRIRRLMPMWTRALTRNIAEWWPSSSRLPRHLRWKSLLTNLSSTPALAYAQTIAMTTCAARRAIYSTDLNLMLGDAENFERVLSRQFSVNDSDPLSGMLAADIGSLLPDAFLVKVDRASMAVGLEVRPPLLDHTLLEFAARISSKLKIRHGETKWIFKEALAEHLPTTLTSLPKRGFEIPLDQWFLGSLGDVYQDLVLASDSMTQRLSQRHALEKLLSRHKSGACRNGQFLWNILVLAKWLERYRPELPS